MTLTECLEACDSEEDRYAKVCLPFNLVMLKPLQKLCKAMVSMGKENCKGFCQMWTTEYKNVDPEDFE